MLFIDNNIDQFASILRINSALIMLNFSRRFFQKPNRESFLIPSVFSLLSSLEGDQSAKHVHRRLYYHRFPLNLTDLQEGKKENQYHYGRHFPQHLSWSLRRVNLAIGQECHNDNIPITTNIGSKMVLGSVFLSIKFHFCFFRFRKHCSYISWFDAWQWAR